MRDAILDLKYATINICVIIGLRIYVLWCIIVSYLSQIIAVINTDHDQHIYILFVNVPMYIIIYGLDWIYINCKCKLSVQNQSYRYI